MANRLTLHKMARRIHYAASFVLFIFALLYVVTGIIMVKPAWFPPGEATVVTASYALTAPPDTTQLLDLGKNLKHQFGMSGRMEFSRNWRSDIVYIMYRPGLRYDVTVHAALDSVTIRSTAKKSLGEVATRLHRLHGFAGGWQYVAWAVLLDLTAVAMILFALTGIFMWFKMRKTYRWGWFILGGTLTLAVVMFFFLLQGVS